MQCRPVAIVFITCAVNIIFSQSIPAPYEVGTWKNFCQAAVTYTFDDQCANQFSAAVPLFDSMNFKATFYPVINWGPDWNKLRNLAENGHEIGSHSMSHPYALAGMQNEEDELKNSKAEINRQIPGNQCLTIAYPNCNAGTLSLLNAHYIAGRKCQGQLESKTPADFFGISSIICGSQGALNTVQSFNSKVDEAARMNGWSVFLVHEVNNGSGYSPLQASVIEGNLRYMDQNREKFWVSTLSNVVRYIKERNAVGLTVISNQDDQIVLRITDNLPDSIYNVPVTFRRPLPSGWSTAFVSQEHELVESSIAMIHGEQYVVFNAVPDRGDVMLVPDITAAHKIRTSKQHRESLRFRLCDSGLLIENNFLHGSQTEIVLYDFKGVVLGRFKADMQKSKAGLLFFPLGKKVGPAILVLSDRNKVIKSHISMVH